MINPSVIPIMTEKNSQYGQNTSFHSIEPVLLIFNVNINSYKKMKTLNIASIWKWKNFYFLVSVKIIFFWLNFNTVPPMIDFYTINLSYKTKLIFKTKIAAKIKRENKTLILWFIM